jgi:hypothetical protein
MQIFQIKKRICDEEMGEWRASITDKSILIYFNLLCH